MISTYYCLVQRIELVQDNLNTHHNSSFYENLEITKAQQLRRLIHSHYTLKHGSWLNRAEMEFCALSRQCLNKRIATIEKIKTEMIS